MRSLVPASSARVKQLVEMAKDRSLFKHRPGSGEKSQLVWLLELASLDEMRAPVVQCLMWLREQRLKHANRAVASISHCAGFVPGVDWRSVENRKGAPVAEHERQWLKDIETAQRTKPYEFEPAVTDPVKPDRHPWDGFAGEMNFTEVSAGIGLFAAAFEAAGMKCAVLIEPVERSLKLAVRNCSLPQATAQGLADVDPVDAPWTHGLVGGPECQPFSSAGLQKAWGDPRSYTMLRTLHLLAVMKPWWAWLENVSAIETVHEGEVWEVIQEIAFLAGYAVRLVQM